MMSEISKVKTEGKLKTAEDGGNVELIFMYGKQLTELQKKENLLIKGQGKFSPSLHFRRSNLLHSTSSSLILVVVVSFRFISGSTASQDVDHKTFPLYIDILHKVGLETPYEQYTLYGTLGAFVYGTYTPMRKAFYLNKWLHESDESLKDIWAARVNLSAAEQKGGERYLQELRKVPQRFAVLPLSFLLIEGIRVGYRSLSGVFTRRP